MKILVVDDSALVLDWVKMALKSSGHDVITHDGPFGINEIVKSHQPSLILLDINMPALNGNRLCKLLKNHMPSLKVVFHSSMSSAEQTALVTEAGADGYLEKTQDPVAFVAAVRQFLR